MAGGRFADDGSGGAQIVPGNDSGTGRLLHVDQSAQRHHPAAVVAGLQVLDLLSVLAEAAVRLDAHLKSAAELVEVVYVGGARVSLQGAEDGAQRHIHGLRFDAVHVHKDLWHLRPVARPDTLVVQNRLLLRFGYQVLEIPHGCLVAADGLGLVGNA